MDMVFLSVLNMSLNGAFVISVIILARLLLKKAPKVISYCLWAVAGFRLVVPFSFESVFSLNPFKAKPIPQDIAIQAVPRMNSGVTIVDDVLSNLLPAATPTSSSNPLQLWTGIGSYVWLLGVAGLVVYSLMSILFLKHKLRSAAYIEDNLYEADNLKTPFVIGLCKPKIYLPAGLSKQEKGYIVLHEQVHIRRHDHIVKMLAYGILCLHWFNPFVWVAFLLMDADMEMSCDERVLQKLGAAIKKDYSRSLLSLATKNKRVIGGIPLAFCEGSIKERIQNVLRFKKPARLTIIAAVALVVVLGATFAVNRASDDTPFVDSEAEDAVDDLHSASGFLAPERDQEHSPEHESTESQLTAYLSTLFTKAYAPHYEGLHYRMLHYEERIVDGNYTATFYWTMFFLGNGLDVSSDLGKEQEVNFNLQATTKIDAEGLLDLHTLTVLVDNSAVGAPHYAEPVENHFPSEEGADQQVDANSQSLIRIGEHESYHYFFEAIPESEKQVVIDDYRLIRQHLDGSAYEVLESPIALDSYNLFAVLHEGRILLVGHKSDAIVDIKRTCFVSMALDGTDRRTLETLHTGIRSPIFENGLVYYEGWTNAGAFPRPVNTVNIDLSKHEKRQDINGTFLTYRNSLFYWLTPNRTEILSSKSGTDADSEVFAVLPEPVDMYRIDHFFTSGLWTFYAEDNQTYEVEIP